MSGASRPAIESLGHPIADSAPATILRLGGFAAPPTVPWTQSQLEELEALDRPVPAPTPTGVPTENRLVHQPVAARLPPCLTLAPPLRVLLRLGGAAPQKTSPSFSRWKHYPAFLSSRVREAVRAVGDSVLKK